MVDLFIEQRGSGTDLVLLHGWGLHGGLWGSVVEGLAAHYRLHLVDLPGHGRSPNLAGAYTLQRVAAVVTAAVPPGAHWLGWSLGGMVALQAALDGAAITRLLLVGAGPRFVQGDDWPDATPAALLGQFAEQLSVDYRTTLNRFLALQSQGSAEGRMELRTLRSALFAHGEPDPLALAGGLECLQQSDLRPRLGELRQPTLLIQGSHDTLFPLRAAEASVALMAHGQLAPIRGAGHAPFLSHPEAFLCAVEAFIHE